jgi:tRNA uridine 5-carboxymethylaminomethyl modification enzyme
VRQDNALRRLGAIGTRLNLYSEHEVGGIEARLRDEDSAFRLAENTSISPDQAASILAEAGSSPLSHSQRIAEVAKRQNVSLGNLFRAVDVGADLDAEVLITTDLEIKYAGYFDRERAQADKMQRMGDFALSPEIDYADIRSLSFEARQKLAHLRPVSLAQASRIPGVSPSDLQNLVIEIERRRRLTITQ